ncbi:hypothetical protein Sfum_0082 [Syntrophobacter fumaroxidans MPOB]|uniref:Uncharacterized protein n=1 Tax=Syntrophobacter fumaroxidans (strain DSM 10017 / MPOB) TaxID=335543 RepID=A0LED3_SYNFM|nr:hypothetical protein Sfum_0082 [Syntrophobacter fumaroxidans MPOB]
MRYRQAAVELDDTSFRSTGHRSHAAVRIREKRRIERAARASAFTRTLRFALVSPRLRNGRDCLYSRAQKTIPDGFTLAGTEMKTSFEDGERGARNPGTGMDPVFGSSAPTKCRVPVDIPSELHGPLFYPLSRTERPSGRGRREPRAWSLPAKARDVFREARRALSSLLKQRGR